MEADAETRRDLVRRFRENYGLEAIEPDRLDQALTHSSYSSENGDIPNNERLEFFGDAIIAAVCSDLLFHAYPELSEGALSKLRARLVSRKLLGSRAKEMNLGALLFLGKGEQKSGGGLRSSVLGSALEAVVAVVFIERGYADAERFSKDHILGPLLEEIGEDRLLEDYKSALQEWSQREKKGLPAYEVVEESGPSHDKHFRVVVRVEGELLGEAEGSKIKSAENEAARVALERIRR